MVSGIIISVVTIVVAICIIVGLFKGFSGTSSWAVEYLLTAVITLAAFSVIDLGNDILNLSLSFGITILLLLIFAFISTMIRNSLNRKIADARLYSYYETYGDREQNILEIRDAIERGDKAQYKELTKRKMKEKTGACGALDRLLGVINMCIKGFVLCTLIAVAVLFVLQCTQLSFVKAGGALYSVYSSGIWQFLAPYVLDLIVIAILQLVIRAGYRSGILTALFALVVLALIGGAGFAAYYLAFKAEVFVSLAAGASSPTIAKLVIMAVLFVVEFVIIMVLAAIAGNAISGAREEKAVSVIDGVIGAIVFTAIAIAVLLFVGMLLYALHGFAVMNTLNSYGTSSALFSCLYNGNPLNDISVFANLQTKIAGFFGG